MTKQLRKRILICLFLFVFGVFAITILNIKLNEEENNRKIVEINIRRQISEHRDDQNPIIDVAKATIFPWERLYVFGPYSSPERINKELGFIWLGAYFSQIKTSDQINLLIFVKNSRVVQIVEFPRISGGDFLDSDGISYPFHDSCFKIEPIENRIVLTSITCNP